MSDQWRTESMHAAQLQDQNAEFERVIRELCDTVKALQGKDSSQAQEIQHYQTEMKRAVESLASKEQDYRVLNDELRREKEVC
jgi:chromosome segregation ATPase